MTRFSLPHLIFAFILLVGGGVFAQEFPNTSTAKFIRHESTNDYKPSTTVSKDYQPGRNRIFHLQYLEIPVSDLNVTDSHIGSQKVRDQILVQRGSQTFFRFFIHPESEALYQPLIQKYGWAGSYWAAPTSSTRSVVAWSPEGTGPPLYLKLSLAQYQDGMGRVIPDWEVRRSVGISQILAKTPDKMWEQHGATVIPEFIGATVKRKEGLGFLVDENQGQVFEHGMIAREADFLSEENNKLEVMPLFGLFTKRNGRPPLIISLWQKSGQKNFYDFVDEFLFKPFLEKNAYLFFHQGIVPEIHGQNVLVAYDPKTEKIVHFYHRDVGSMNVDLRMRYIRGLDISALRTENAAFDFKFARATEKYESVHMDYLNDWLFRWGYLSTLKEYIPTFSPERTKARLKKLLLERVKLELPLRSKTNYDTVEAHLKAFYSENPPLNWKPIELQTNPEKVKAFMKSQAEKSQFLDLPASWIPQISFLQGDLLFTEYGLLHIERDKGLRLYYYASLDIQGLKAPRSKAVEIAKLRKRTSVKKVGFYSGTFDPPHQGHLALVEKAVRELQLDEIYIIPNLDPSHKPGASGNADRLQMAKLAFSHIPEAKVADPQLMAVVERYGVGGLQSYLSDLHKDDLVFQIMGDDSYTRLKGNSEIKFPKNFVIAVSARNDDFEVLETSLGKTRVVALTPDFKGYSSTLFRAQIKTGERPDQIPSSVLNYVNQRGLYQGLRCSRVYH